MRSIWAHFPIVFEIIIFRGFKVSATGGLAVERHSGHKLMHTFIAFSGIPHNQILSIIVL
jgi:hypothetical protein